MKRVMLLFLTGSIVMLHSCTISETSTPQVTFFNSNVLLPQIHFTTRDSSAVSIEYWPEQRKHRKQTSEMSYGRDHTLTLFNVKPNTKYIYNIVTSEKSNQQRDEFSFETDSVPEAVFRIRKDKMDTTLFDGHILIRRFFKSGADALIDNEGDIVWYNLYDTAVRRAFTWTDHQTILSIYDSAYIIETDLLGRRVQDLNLEKLGIPNKVHHEVIYDHNNENIIALTLDSARYDLRKFGGEKDQYLRADGILVLTRDGKIKWEWNVLQVADPMKFEGPMNLKESWGHANSIALDKDGHYIVSFRDFNQAWKISSTDGSVIWKLGAKGDFDMPKESEFIRQHSIHFNPRGELMMFDNGDLKIRPNSKIIAFELNEADRKARPTINITLPRSLTSYRMCSAELLEDGKYLVCTTRKDGTLAIVNEEGEILWKAVADNATYRAYYIKDAFRKNEQVALKTMAR